MNVLTIFDQRINAIFEEGAPGQRKPFSFKRLAKRAVREMEDETFVIDGVDTAPALYTVLISAKDDALMRPMYARICEEISQLVEAQAKKRGYTFVGRPLVRFMVDPGLRGGRFSVFAENIDPRTLARLRDEENVYLGITPPRDVHFGQGFVPQPIPVEEEEPSLVSSEVAFVDEPVEDELDFEPEIEPQPMAEEEVEEPEPVPVSEISKDSVPTLGSEPFFTPNAPVTQEPIAPKHIAPEVPEPIAPEPIVPEVSEVPEVLEVPEAELPVQDEDPEVVVPGPVDEVVETFEEEPTPVDPILNIEELEVSPTMRRKENPTTVVDAAPEPVTTVVTTHRQPDTCTLTDVATRRSYQIFVSRTPIGRERREGGIVLRDPNASRRHAELVYEDGVWKIRDLNSTNGTLVDDMDVHEAVLADGDVITIGLTNLEFKVS